ncbi:MAG: (deoxy)nucleoside triphosphate pyrophosphohydrolase [Planctomycetota bacterium]
MNDPAERPESLSSLRSSGMDRGGDHENRPVRVAVGVLGRRHGNLPDGNPEVLIALRRADGVLGGLWEFPGGKLESGESAEAALVREMREELGIEIRVSGRLTEVQHRYDHGAVRLEVFGCALADLNGPEPEALAADAVRWVDADGLASAAFPEANGPIVKAARDWMANGFGALPDVTGSK